MKTNLAAWIVLVASLPSPAMAIDIATQIYYESDSLSSTYNETETKTRFGLQVLQPVFQFLAIGGKFFHQSEQYKTDTVTEVTTQAYMGPSIGFAPLGGFGPSASLTYCMFPTRTTKIEGEVVDHGGSGINLDVGYRAQVVPMVTLGPVLSYTSLSFKKRTTDDAELTLNDTRTQIQGLFGVWVRL